MIPIYESYIHDADSFPLDEFDLKDPASCLRLLDMILALPDGSYALAPAHVDGLKEIAQEAKEEVLRRHG